MKNKSLEQTGDLIITLISLTFIWNLVVCSYRCAHQLTVFAQRNANARRSAARKKAKEKAQKKAVKKDGSSKNS